MAVMRMGLGAVRVMADVSASLSYSSVVHNSTNRLKLS
jgi:hypothetical protein